MRADVLMRDQLRIISDCAVDPEAGTILAFDRAGVTDGTAHVC